MAKQPADTDKDVTSYTLRDIPKALWQKAQIRAIQQDRTMRDVLIGLLRAYVAGKVDPKEV
jgi:hypothetical protein